MHILQGKALVKGIAAGKIVKLLTRPDIEKTFTAAPEQELQKLREALQRLKAERSSIQTEKPAAAILKAQQELVEDPEFLQVVQALVVEKKLNAAYAVVQGGEQIAQELEQLENAYLRTRAIDMRQMSQRLAEILMGYKDQEIPREPVILAAEDFTPEQLAKLDKNNILGLVALKGQLTSHTAILANSYGLPYLAGIALQTIKDGEMTVLDGDSGCLVLEPDEKLLQKAEAKQRENLKLSCAKADATRMKVYANIASVEDLQQVLRYQADGIGLFRTEFLYMNRQTAPDEEEQFRVYQQVLGAMGDREVIIRTIDIGTDKPVAYLPLGQERNPALGLRGIRVSLRFPELFRVQLKALLRAACYGNLAVMLPMIVSRREIDLVKQQLKLASAELEQRGEQYKLPKLGIMIETPAAALMSKELAEQVDFFSIGTNDLIQYTLALDRQAEGMDQYYEPHHEAVLRLLAMTVEGAHAHHIPVGICGELGADLELLPQLVKMGLDEVSVAVAAVTRVRQTVAAAEAALLQEEALKTVAWTNETEGLEEEICAPVDGALVPMEEIPDQTFAQGILGKCFGIAPADGHIYAPVAGTITNVAETGHAITMLSEKGNELLIHVGLNTVSLKGDGFAVKVAEGQLVARNELLLEADLKKIKAIGLNPMVITVQLN